VIQKSKLGGGLLALWTATKGTHEQHLMKSSKEKRITLIENSKIENTGKERQVVTDNSKTQIMTVLSRSRP
jgi:hypothetical protein